MTTIKLIELLKKCPETADVYFDDHEDGLVLIETLRVASPKEKAAAGREKKPAIVLSDA
jgi:hypothetical protein